MEERASTEDVRARVGPRASEVERVRPLELEPPISIIIGIENAVAAKFTIVLGSLVFVNRAFTKLLLVKVVFTFNVCLVFVVSGRRGLYEHR